MMEKIYAEMYCSALGPTEVKFYVESGASDEFIKIGRASCRERV